MKSRNLTNRIRRLERIPPTQCRELDGVRVSMPWERRARIIERIDDALQKKALGKTVNAEGFLVFERFSEQTLRRMRQRYLGNGPAADWITVPKSALILLPHEERRKRIEAIAVKLSIGIGPFGESEATPR